MYRSGIWSVADSFTHSNFLHSTEEKLPLKSVDSEVTELSCTTGAVFVERCIAVEFLKYPFLISQNPGKWENMSLYDLSELNL